MGKILWQIRDFKILILGQTIAVLGDWFGIIAIIALAGFQWQVTPVQMSIVIVSLAAPMMLLGPLGGVIIDRVDRAKAMITIDILRAIVLLFIANAKSFPFLIAFLFVLGCLDACFLPAKNAKLKEVPPPELLNDAVIYSSFIDQGAKIIGPALGGALLAILSVKVALYLNAATYLISAIIFCFLQKSSYKSSSEKNNFFAEFKDGLQVARKIPFLVYGALVQFFVVFTLQIVDSQFVILLRNLPKADEAWVGYNLMVSGIGTVLATYFYVRRNKNLDVKFSMFLGLLLYGCSIIGISLWGKYFEHPAGFLPFFLVWGASGALIFVKFIAYVQEKIPGQYSGRIIGSLASMISGASLLGLLSGGFLVSFLGPTDAFLLSGVITMIGGVWFGFKIRIVVDT